ncbi:MAG: hypothetical protein JW814_04010 [Candidatus Krumholzibacteriota bacterium]|nr:hypothetical protein [Candidatus Krumholzibacteriota bacterium]
MKSNITVIGAIHIAWGLLGMLLAMIIQLTLGGAGMITGDYEVQRILAIVASSLAFPLFILGIPALVGGIGILRMRPWARILLLAYSFINLLSIPFGTVLGIFTIKLLLDRDTIEAFAIENGALAGYAGERRAARSESVSSTEEDDDIVS